MHLPHGMATARLVDPAAVAGGADVGSARVPVSFKAALTVTETNGRISSGSGVEHEAFERHWSHHRRGKHRDSRCFRSGEIRGTRRERFPEEIGKPPDASGRGGDVE